MFPVLAISDLVFVVFRVLISLLFGLRTPEPSLGQSLSFDELCSRKNGVPLHPEKYQSRRLKSSFLFVGPKIHFIGWKRHVTVCGTPTSFCTDTRLEPEVRWSYVRDWTCVENKILTSLTPGLSRSRVPVCRLNRHSFVSGPTHGGSLPERGCITWLPPSFY